jgi:hypothetical protein
MNPTEGTRARPSFRRKRRARIGICRREPSVQAYLRLVRRVRSDVANGQLSKPSHRSLTYPKPRKTADAVSVAAR